MSVSRVDGGADRCVFGGDKMMQRTISMATRKSIALVAHDNKKEELVEWAKSNCKSLAEHSLYSTSATGQLLQDRLGLNVTLLESGPWGGDLQIGSRISEGQIDFVIFFSDPLQSQPHDPDVKALLRITVVWNVPVACNRASADFIISSSLMSTAYERLVPDYSKYRARPAVGTRSKPAAERPAEDLRLHNLGVHEMDWRKSRSISGKPSNTSGPVRPRQVLREKSSEANPVRLG
jgi:methylglyoxal synthase